MRLLPSVIRFITWTREKTGVRYAVKAYSCLDEQTQRAVIEDMKAYAVGQELKMIETDLLKCFKRGQGIL